MILLKHKQRNGIIYIYSHLFAISKMSRNGFFANPSKYYPTKNTAKHSFFVISSSPLIWDVVRPVAVGPFGF